MSKWGVLGHILEGVATVALPGAGLVIKAGHDIHDQHGQARSDAILAEIDASLAAAGDLSGKAALADPALRALAKKWAQDGIELHTLIEQAKQKAPAPATAAE